VKSVHQMIDQLEGLIDTKDVSEWENGFLKSIQAMREEDPPQQFSTKQLDVIDRIYNKHFA
jgi:hypothetical protein